MIKLRDFLRLREAELMEEMSKLHDSVGCLERELTAFREAIAVLDRNAATSNQAKPSVTMNATRELLIRNESDTANRVSEIRQREIAPRERELAEVRRCKAAIGFTALVEGVTAVITGIERFASAASEVQNRFASLSLMAPRADFPAIPAPRVLTDSISPYASLTMKQLVVKALKEHFHHGATTRELLDFFRDAWGRRIERANLSPQISRLVQEGIIGREESGKRWYLVPADRLGKKRYHRHAMQMTCGELVSMGYQTVWLKPNEVGPHDDPAPEPSTDDDE